MRYEAGQDIDGHFAKACPFATKPVLERLLTDVDTIQKISDVKGGGLFERLRSVTGGELFELDHVDDNCGWIKDHALGLDHQDMRLGESKRAPKRAEALPEAVPSLLLPHCAPEHCCELVT